MHDFFCPDDLPSEGLTDGLMAETNPKERNLSPDSIDERYRNTGVLGSAGTGRDYDFFRTKLNGSFNGQFIITINDHLGTELPDILDKVIGKRVVIVDNENHADT
jgi:hypothetical protein